MRRSTTREQAQEDDGFGPAQRGGRRRGRTGRDQVEQEPTGKRQQSAAHRRDTPSPGRDAERGRARGDPDDYGPAQHGGPGTRLPGLTLALTRRRLVIAPLVLVGALLVYALTLTAYANLSMDEVAVSGLSGGTLRLNVLVVGTDSREGLTEEQLQALGTRRVGGDRTDTVLLFTVRGGRAALLSFPRDLWVTRCDGEQARLNSAYAVGGPSCLVETVKQASGIPLTHYVEVDFTGFMELVDAVGGISMFLDQPMVDRAAGVDLPAGCVELDGEEAMGFVRARHGGSDLLRIGRQQRFLGEVVDELTTPMTLLNPVRLFRVAGAAGRAVTTDERLGPIDLLRIGRGARGLAGGGVATYTVPASPARVGGASVLMPDEQQAEQLFARFRDGSVLAGAPERAEPSAEAAPSDGRAAPTPQAPDQASPDTSPAAPQHC